MTKKEYKAYSDMRTLVKHSTVEKFTIGLHDLLEFRLDNCCGQTGSPKTEIPCVDCIRDRELMVEVIRWLGW